MAPRKNKRSAVSTGNSIASDANFEFSSKQNGLRLANMLKLKKSVQWINYEWFYGHIDQPFFHDNNDFEKCLQKSFPRLKLRQLTRIEWNKVRRLLGKRRRCSSSFFRDSRMDLERHRQAVRILQASNPSDLKEIASLGSIIPRNLPGQLPDGCRVTTLVRESNFTQGGAAPSLRSGVIEGSSSGITLSYKIKLENLETFVIPDFEVFPSEGIKVPTPLSEIPRIRDVVSGNHPINLLKLICCLKKFLKEKQQKLNLLIKTHDEIHLLHSLEQRLQKTEFDIGYATLDLLYHDLENLNNNCLSNLEQILGFTLGKEAFVLSHCRTSIYLEQKWEEKVHRAIQKYVTDVDRYPEPIVRLLKEFAKLLCLLIEEKKLDQRSSNAGSNLYAHIVNNIKYLINDGNIDVYVEYLSNVLVVENFERNSVL